jgi:hypothetical protein
VIRPAIEVAAACIAVNLAGLMLCQMFLRYASRRR